MRVIYSIIKGIDPARAREALDLGLASMPGPPPRCSSWSDHQYTPGTREMTALVVGDTLLLSDDAWQLAEAVGRQQNAVTLELRVQEGDHWDFSLSRDGELLADFSTRVGAFADDPDAPRPWKAGSLTAFAEAWGIAPDRVAPFLLDWDAQHEPVFVVPGTEFPTGDWRQVYDFMHTIGIPEPASHPDRFTIEVPCWKGVYRRQPLWRRAVRRLSVWYKGVYPDCTRKTQAEREAWRRRKASVRVEIVDAGDLFDR